jgi:hypothetical protein
MAVVEVTDGDRAGLLDALDAAGGYVEAPGTLTPDVAADHRLLILTDVWKRRLVEVAHPLTNGAGELAGAHDVYLTDAGRSALADYRRSAGRSSDGTPVVATSLEEKQRRRAAFLRALYEATDGDRLDGVDPAELGAMIGMSSPETDAVVNYLCDEQLVEFQTLGLLSITHPGVAEVEAGMRRPTEDTSHFPGSVIVQVFGDVNAPLQAAGFGNMQQIGGAVGDAVLREFLAELVKVLPTMPIADEDRDAAAADLEALQAQLASPKPRPAVVHALTTILGNLALGVAGNGAYDGLVALAHQVLR